jgi:phage shock protein A
VAEFQELVQRYSANLGIDVAVATSLLVAISAGIDKARAEGAAEAAEQLAAKDQIIADTRASWIECQDRLANIEEQAQYASGVFDAGAADCIGIMATRATKATDRIAELERINGALRDSREVLRGKVSELERIFARDSQRIAELEAENTRLKASARFAELESDNSRLKSLSRFARHKWDCRLNMSAAESCTCGFRAALAQSTK